MYAGQNKNMPDPLLSTIALAEEPMPEQRARMLVVLPACILLLYQSKEESSLAVANGPIR
jgi:hypothetical protein